MFGVCVYLFTRFGSRTEEQKSVVSRLVKMREKGIQVESMVEKGK
jgi:hypothetical protein